MATSAITINYLMSSFFFKFYFLNTSSLNESLLYIYQSKGVTHFSQTLITDFYFMVVYYFTFILYEGKGEAHLILYAKYNKTVKVC